MPKPKAPSFETLVRSIARKAKAARHSTGKTCVEWAEEWNMSLLNTRNVVKALVANGKMVVETDYRDSPLRKGTHPIRVFRVK